MLFDVAIAAIRMIAWVVVFGAVLPRLLHRGGQRDAITAVATAAVAVQVIALALWLGRLLEPAALILALGVCVLVIQLRRRAQTTRDITRAVWHWCVDAFAEPPSSLTRSDRESIESMGVLPVAWRARWRKGGTMDRLRGWLGTPAGHRMLTLTVAALGAIGVALARARRPYPLCAAEVTELLQREGSLPHHGAWLPDLVVARVAEMFTGAPPVVVSIAIAAPLVFATAWSGMALMRRLAPDAPLWFGALAGGLAPAHGLAVGHAATLHVMAGALVPWACLAGASLAVRHRWPARIPMAVALVHPFSGLLAGILAGGSLLARQMRAKVAQPLPMGMLITAGLTLVASTAMAWSAHARGPWSSSEPVLRPATAMIAALASAWLLLGGPRPRGTGVVAAGRALAIVTLASTFLAGGFDATVHAPSMSIPAAVMASIAVAVCAADLLTVPRWRHVARPAIVLLLALVSWLSIGPATALELRADAVQAAVALRRRHMPWMFGVIGPARARPAFAGLARFVDATQRLRAGAPKTEAARDVTTYLLVDTSSPADPAVDRLLQSLRASSSSQLVAIDDASSAGLRVYAVVPTFR